MPEIGNVTSDKLSKNVALETKLMLETSIFRKIYSEKYAGKFSILILTQ